MHRVDHSVHEASGLVKLVEACRLSTSADVLLKTVSRRGGCTAISCMNMLFRWRLGRTPAQFW
jgi:hypothetical protein